MSEQRLTVHKIIERLGLDWFILLIGKPAFEDAPLPYPTTFSEIREKLGDLRDKEKLDDAIEYCSSLLKREEDRSDKVESKAFTLIGITGIATGFITGFAGLLLDRDKITSTSVLIPAAALYILVVISLMWTIYLAVKVVIVGDYRFTYPSANDIFDLSNATLNHVKRERAASLFYSFAQNVQVVNRKATYLGGAQLWFRNSIVLLLVLTLLLAVCAPLMPTSVPGVPTPPIGSGSTVQPTRAPTDTPQATPMPTGTPTRTPTSTPTCTLTATPTAIVQSSPTVTATLSP
jgi:hypothetical protein